MKKPVIKISPANTETEFVYGQCVIKAVCQCFNLQEKVVVLVAGFMKLKPLNGLNFYECKKLINKLGETFRFRVKWVSNRSKIEYGQMLTVLNEGRYIAMFDIHLSYSHNGEVFDDYFYDDNEEIRLKNLQKIPTGWWEIK